MSTTEGMGREIQDDDPSFFPIGEDPSTSEAKAPDITPRDKRDP